MAVTSKNQTNPQRRSTAAILEDLQRASETYKVLSDATKRCDEAISSLDQDPGISTLEEAQNASRQQLEDKEGRLEILRRAQKHTSDMLSSQHARAADGSRVLSAAAESFHRASHTLAELDDGERVEEDELSARDDATALLNDLLSCKEELLSTSSSIVSSFRSTLDKRKVDMETLKEARDASVHKAKKVQELRQELKEKASELDRKDAVIARLERREQMIQRERERAEGEVEELRAQLSSLSSNQRGEEALLKAEHENKPWKESDKKPKQPIKAVERCELHTPLKEQVAAQGQEQEQQRAEARDNSQAAGQPPPKEDSREGKDEAVAEGRALSAPEKVSSTEDAEGLRQELAKTQEALKKANHEKELILLELSQNSHVQHQEASEQKSVDQEVKELSRALNARDNRIANLSSQLQQLEKEKRAYKAGLYSEEERAQNLVQQMKTFVQEKDEVSARSALNAIVELQKESKFLLKALYEGEMEEVRLRGREEGLDEMQKFAENLCQSYEGRASVTRDSTARHLDLLERNVASLLELLKSYAPTDLESIQKHQQEGEHISGRIGHLAEVVQFVHEALDETFTTYHWRSERIEKEMDSLRTRCRWLLSTIRILLLGRGDKCKSLLPGRALRAYKEGKNQGMMHEQEQDTRLKPAAQFQFGASMIPSEATMAEDAVGRDVAVPDVGPSGQTKESVNEARQLQQVGFSDREQDLHRRGSDGPRSLANTRGRARQGGPTWTALRRRVSTSDVQGGMKHQPGDANQEDGNVHSKWAPKETFPKGVQVDEIGASTQDNGQDKEAQASTQLHADGLVEKVASRVSTMRHYFLRQAKILQDYNASLNANFQTMENFRRELLNVEREIVHEHISAKNDHSQPQPPAKTLPFLPNWAARPSGREKASRKEDLAPKRSQSVLGRGRTLFAGTTDSQTSSRGEYRTERWPDDATDHSPSRLRAPSRKFSHVSHYQEFDQEQDDDKGNASPSPSPSPSTEGMASLEVHCAPLPGEFPRVGENSLHKGSPLWRNVAKEPRYKVIRKEGATPPPLKFTPRSASALQ